MLLNMKKCIPLAQIVFISVFMIFLGLLLFYFKLGNVVIQAEAQPIIYVSYFFLGTIFFISFIIKQKAKNDPTKAKTFVAKILGTLMLKMFALILLVVFIYYVCSKDILQMVRIYLIGFFLFFSLLELVLLSQKMNR